MLSDFCYSADSDFPSLQSADRPVDNRQIASFNIRFVLHWRFERFLQCRDMVLRPKGPELLNAVTNKVYVDCKLFNSHVPRPLPTSMPPRAPSFIHPMDPTARSSMTLGVRAVGVLVTTVEGSSLPSQPTNSSTRSSKAQEALLSLRPGRCR